MKNYLKSTILAPIFLGLMAFMPQNPSVIPAPIVNMNTGAKVENETFQSGEELVYKIYYNLNFVWIPAGEVTFSIKDEGAQYHLAATGRTYGSYDWFFKVRDSYDSYVDKNTMLPNYSVRDISEGKYRLYDKISFDQNAKKAYFERGNNKALIEAKGTIDLQECMHDVLSTVYYCRTLNYDNVQPGQEFPVKMMLDEEVHPLKYRFLGREDKKIKELGKWDAYRFSPQVVAGNVFKEGSQMKVWASADANKLPLMIESPVSVGSVKVVLKSYKGLKYDVTAKRD